MRQETNCRVDARWWLLMIILGGFLLRVYALGYLAPSPDEARVLTSFIRIPALEIVTSYHTANHIFSSLLSHMASSLLGENLFVLRWPSVILGALGIAATARMAYALFDEHVAILSACLITFSAFHLEYSQKIRGYAGLLFFVTMSFYFLWSALRSNRWSSWMAFAASGALAPYTHLFGGMALGAYMLIALAWIVYHRHRAGRLLWRATVARMAVAFSLLSILLLVLLGPVLPQIFKVPEREHEYDSDIPLLSGSVSLLGSAISYFDLFHILTGYALPGWVFATYGILALIGMVVGIYRGEWGATGALLVWLLFPLALSLASLSMVEGFYLRYRFFIFLLPPFLVLVSRGLVAVLRAVSRQSSLPLRGSVPIAVLSLILAGVNVLPLEGYYKARAQGDWLAVSNYLASVIAPDDLVICEAYHHGWKAADLDPSDDCTRSVSYHLERHMTRIYPLLTLETVASYDYISQYPIVAARDARVWVVIWGIDDASTLGWAKESGAFSSDRFGNTVVIGPEREGNLIDSLINVLQDVLEIAPTDSERFAHLVRLVELYAATGRSQRAEEVLASTSSLTIDHPEADAQLEAAKATLTRPPLMILPDHPMLVMLGQNVQFNGYSLAPATVTPGDTVKVTLFWELITPTQEDYTIFLHVRDSANQTVAQQDFQPFKPTSAWWSGDKVHETRELTIPLGTRPGEYRLLVGMYRVDTLERLPVSGDMTGENAIELSGIQVN